MSLAPPTQQLEDPGAHELTESSDEHFSDASEGRQSIANPSSPVPTTRVERVDDAPSHGEIPGTSAYKLRTHDAVPDEMEVVPEGQRSRSASQVWRDGGRPSTPGGTMIPKTVVEKVEPDNPSHGEVPGTAAFDMRRADAEPDEVLTGSDDTRASLQGEPTENHRSRSPVSDNDRPNTTIEPVEESQGTFDEDVAEVEVETEGDIDGAQQEETEEDDGFGDDFDDFEEGGGDGDDDDFGDFGEADVDEPTTPVPSGPASIAFPDPLAHLPSLDFDDAESLQDIQSLLQPYLQDIFPDLDVPSLLSKDAKVSTPEPLLSDRSASLWSQLVAPPPLQPPNWIRSRIRRLFLVSLGVPVDLDEILPASKQKKLILPSIHLTVDTPGTDTPRMSSNLSRLKKENTSSTSVGSSASKSGESAKKERKKAGTSERPGPPPPPAFDSNAASLLCSTTDTAMTSFTDDELRLHVTKLEELSTRANEVLEYWLKRKDSAMGDKEAFEGVIENLVGFVRKSKQKR